MSALRERDGSDLGGGGLGTRLRPVVADRPKILAPVLGNRSWPTCLEHLAGQGLREVVLCVGYRGEQVEADFGRSYAGIDVAYSRRAFAA